MGAESTVYDIRLRYMMEDRASGKGKELERSLDRAAASGGRLGNVLRGVGAAAAGVFGVGAAKRAFIDFNDQMEQAKIQMAGMLQLNAGGDFADNMQRATELVQKFQEEAKTSVGTTEDFTQMSAMLVRPLTLAGAQMSDIVQLTKGAVVASRAFGVEAGMAALDIEQALMGTLSKKDRFARALLEPMGMDTQKFNALNERARMETLRKALTQPALQEMAKAQGNSFAGVMSTLKDTMRMFQGKVGKPVFSEITREIKHWNEWIEKNGAAMDRFGRQASNALVTGFSAVRESLGFMVQHKELLMKLAMAWGAVKVAGGAKGLAMGLAANVSGGKGGWKGGLGRMGMALGAGFLAEEAMGAYSTRQQNKNEAGQYAEFLSQAGKFGSVVDRVQEAKKLEGQQDYMERAKAVRADFDAAAASMRSLAEGLGASNVDELKARLNELYASANLANDRFRELAGIDAKDTQAALDKARTLLHRYGDRIFADAPDIDPKGQTPANKDIKVTINRIEVKSDDPDRFTFSLAESLNDTIKSGSAAFGALREG